MEGENLLQVVFDALGDFRGDTRRGGQLLEGGLADGLQRAKVAEQPLAARRADAGDFIQHGGHAEFGALLAVGGDGKAVGLVADALDEVEPLRVAR